MLSRQVRPLILIFSPLLFFVACALPAARIATGPPWLGKELLAAGFLGPLVGQFAWYANPLWLGSLIAAGLRRRRWTLLLSLAAVAVGLLMLTLPGHDIPRDEGGVNKDHAEGLLYGAWVWLASIALPALGAALSREEKRHPQ